MLVLSLHIVLHDNLMPWAITGQLILKVPPWAARQHHLSFSSGWVYFTSQRAPWSIQQDLKALLPICDCDRPCLHEGRRHLRLTANCAGLSKCVWSLLLLMPVSKSIHTFMMLFWETGGARARRQTVQTACKSLSQSVISPTFDSTCSVCSHQQEEFCHFVSTTRQMERSSVNHRSQQRI